MKFRGIPRTELVVSEIGLNLGPVVRGAAGADPMAAARLARQAYDHGMNFLVAADGVHTPAVERFIGEALGEAELKNRVVATQVPPLAGSLGVRGAAVEAACENALRRLGVAAIDILLVPYPERAPEAADELPVAVERLTRAGKIRAAGVLVPEPRSCSGDGRAVLEAMGAPVAHVEFHPFQQSVADCATLMDRAVTGQTAWMANAGSLAASLSEATGGSETASRLAERFRALLSDLGRTPDQLAAQFALSKPWVVAAFPDIRVDSAIEDFASAPQMPALSDADLGALLGLWQEWDKERRRAARAGEPREPRAAAAGRRG